jgi:release factor glutamine methyltransferase
MCNNNVSWSTIDVLGWAKKCLIQHGIETAITDAEWLLEEVTGLDRYTLYLQNRKLSIHEIIRYKELIKRRCKHEPVAYIIGYKYFIDWKFVVTPDVLIPRWETEVLVLEIVKQCKDISICIELGTGSGIIAISLAKLLPDVHIYATELSPQALQVAWLNAERLNVSDKITFLQGNMFTPVEGLNLDNLVDLIVSNPPYVPTYEIDKLPKSVRCFEPRYALDGGKDGLKYYREIIDNAKVYLKHYGYLVFEVGINQARDVGCMMQNKGFDVYIKKDLTGIERVILGRLTRVS